MTDELPDIICPKCGQRHGPAAKSCECGLVFESDEDDPGPAKGYFIAAAFCTVAAFISAAWWQDHGEPLNAFGLPIAAAILFTLGLRAWLYHWRRR